MLLTDLQIADKLGLYFTKKEPDFIEDLEPEVIKRRVRKHASIKNVYPARKLKDVFLWNINDMDKLCRSNSQSETIAPIGRSKVRTKGSAYERLLGQPANGQQSKSAHVNRIKSSAKR